MATPPLQTRGRRNEARQPGNARTYNGLDGFIATNLLRTGQSSLSNVVTSHGPASTWFESGLNDGAGNAVSGGQAGLVFYPNGGSGTLPVTITFNLNTNNGTGGATNGYDINSLQAISGWSSANLANQNFQVLLSINNGPFNNYGGFIGTSSLSGGNNSVMTTVASSSGPIARNVTAIQFVFSVSPTGNGGIVIHELQAFGTPSPTNSVPAPYRICAVGGFDHRRLFGQLGLDGGGSSLASAAGWRPAWSPTARPSNSSATHLSLGMEWVALCPTSPRRICASPVRIITRDMAAKPPRSSWAT